MIYITGDTHGHLDINKLKDLQPKVCEEDYIIVLGDFGLPGFCGRKHDRALMQFYRNFKCKILFLDGNHENFYSLNLLRVTQWNGGRVQYVADNIIHLMRGEIYTLGGVSILTCGGGLSIDKNIRTLGVDYFLEEELSYREFEYMVDNIRDRTDGRNEVDYVLTHVPYSEVMELICEINGYRNIPDSTSQALRYLSNTVKYKRWYCAHMHEDMDIDTHKTTVLYNKVIVLGETIKSKC